MKKYFIGFWLVVLLIIEWVVELVVKLVAVVHGGVRELTLMMDKIYNDLKLKSESDRGKAE